MKKLKEPFELVVHIDEAGTRATASYRTRLWDDDGTLIDAATTIDSVTLEQLGNNFPWTEYIGEALKGALLVCEKSSADLTEAKAEIERLTAASPTGVVAV